MKAVLNVIIPIVLIIIPILVKYYGAKISYYFEEKLRNENVTRVVSIAVNAVEQLNKQYNFTSKFDEAKKRAIEMLDERGIYINDNEIDNCIESVVSEFNKYKSKEKIPEIPKGAELSE